MHRRLVAEPGRVKPVEHDIAVMLWGSADGQAGVTGRLDFGPVRSTAVSYMGFATKAP